MATEHIGIGGAGRSTISLTALRRLIGIFALGCMSILVWVGLAVLLSTSAHASPAAPIKITLKQPDGKTFYARQFGDEWNNGFETSEGYTIVRARGTRRWEFATKGPRGTLQPSGRMVGLESPPAVKEHLRSDAVSVSRSPQVQGPALSIPNTGTQKNLVILLKFPDQAAVGSTPAQWNAKFFGASNSVKSYYQEVSYGKLNMAPAAESHGTANDGVVGWLTMSYNHPNTATSPPGTANQQLARDAVQAANPYVNYAAFDSNSDGFLSSRELHVTVIVAGYEASYDSTCGKSVWGHRWSLSGTQQPTVDGVVFGDAAHGGGYTEFGEWHCDHMATIGIMVHELGHDLYLPDLYDTNPADGTSAGVGKWSVMGDDWSALPGNYQGTSPSHFDAWSKSYEGWITPQRASGIQTIDQAETNATAIQLRDNPNGVDWTYNNSSGTGEYFLVENRQKVGFDAALPGCGLLVWHIDETRPYGSNANADETHKLVDVEEADGINQLDGNVNRGDAGDPYPGSTNNISFNGTSNPNSKLYNGTSSGVASENMNGLCSSTMSATITDPGVTQRPANNDFANAQALTGSSATATGTNVGATKEAGEPNHAGNTGGKSVWYKWTPQASGTATVDTSSSKFDTLLAVYTGSAVNGLTEVARNDDENRAGGVLTSKTSSFPITAGTTYRIAVDGYNNGAGAAEGSITLHLTSTAATQPVTYQENDRDFADYGYWDYYTNASFSAAYSAYSNTPNDYATFKFSGTSITWKTNKLPDGGKTNVYLDGVYQKTFDGYSASPYHNVTGFSKTSLASGNHTLKLVVTGTKNTASSNYYTEIDEFVVDGTHYQENNWRVSFGAWSGYSYASASGGTYRESSSKGEGAFFRNFTGPYVEFITAKGPSRGVATVEIYDAQTGALVKTVSPNLYAPTIQWQAEARIDGLDASKKYYMKVTSADGTRVVVDAYRAFPYQGTQPTAAPGVPEGGGKSGRKG